MNNDENKHQMMAEYKMKNEFSSDTESPRQKVRTESYFKTYSTYKYLISK